MNKKDFVNLFVAILPMLIPAPGRLIYGIVLVVILNLTMFFGTLFQYMVKRLEIKNLRTVLTVTFLISFSVLSKELFVFLSPVIVLQLGIILYFPALSVFVITTLYNTAETELKPGLGKNMYSCALYSVFALLFMLLRDFFGYGTITFPRLNGMGTIQLLNTTRYPIMTFIATIPGAIIISMMLLVILFYISRKISIVKQAGVIDGE